MAIEYFGFYEDFAKVKALAAAQGEDEESYHDLAQSGQGRTSKRFDTLAEAVAWGSKAIADGLTVYGCAEVREFEPVTRRCRYCTCQGSQLVRHHILDGSPEIAESFEDESECCE